MKDIQRGIFDILIAENNHHQIVFSPVEGQVWLSKSQLAELFGVYIQSIEAHLKAIYQKGACDEASTSLYHLYTSRNSIRYAKTDFNLPIIIALSFRIDSYRAKIIRQWVMDKIMREDISELRYCLN